MPGTVPAEVLPAPCRRTHGVARAEPRAEAVWHPTVPITSWPWRHHPASQPVGTLGCSRAGPLAPGAGWSPPGKGPAGTEGHPPAWARAPRLQHLAPPMGNAPPPASLSKEVEAAASQGREPAGHSLSRHQPRPCPPRTCAWHLQLQHREQPRAGSSCARLFLCKSVRAQGLGSAARGPGQDGPRAQASALCTHRHPELQIPGSSRAGAKPGSRSGQRLHRGQRHRVRREQALPRGCSGRHASRGEDEGARQLLLSLAAQGSGGGHPLQPAGTIPAAAELERGRLARRCRADTG